MSSILEVISDSGYNRIIYIPLNIKIILIICKKIDNKFESL